MRLSTWRFGAASAKMTRREHARRAAVRRHPPRRHARCGCGRRGRPTTRRAARVFPRSLRAEPVPALPRPPVGRRAPRRAAARARLAGAGALVGSHRRTRSSRVANYVRLRDPAAAEVAFAVADEYQRRGIGTRLLEQLAALAGGPGSSGFVAESCCPTTVRCSACSRRVGFAVTRELAGGEVEVSVPDRSRPTRYLASVESATSRGRASLRAVLRARVRRRRRRVAPPRARSAASSSATSSQADFAGVGVSREPPGESVAGVRAYTSIEEIPDPVDLAVICVPGEHVLAGRGGRARARACARSASSPPASRRSARRASSGRSGCSRSCARTARG